MLLDAAAACSSASRSSGVDPATSGEVRTASVVLPCRVFQREQSAFHGQAAAESANRAVAGDDAMARDDDGNGIRAAGRADRARGPGFADLLRDPAVGTRFAARDRRQGAPDGLLEGCARGEVEGNAPANGFAGGVLLELAGEFADEERWSERFAARTERGSTRLGKSIREMPRREYSTRNGPSFVRTITESRTR